MSKNIVMYSFLIAIFGLGIFSILKAGSQLMPEGSPADQRSSLSEANSHDLQQQSESHSVGGNLVEKLQQPLSLLLLQIIVIITIARALGMLFTVMGQPAVIGEMVGGILLGPSLLGWLSPQAEAFLFPVSSLELCNCWVRLGSYSSCSSLAWS